MGESRYAFQNLFQPRLVLFQLDPFGLDHILRRFFQKALAGQLLLYHGNVLLADLALLFQPRQFLLLIHQLIQRDKNYRAVGNHLDRVGEILPGLGGHARNLHA